MLAQIALAEQGIADDHLSIEHDRLQQVQSCLVFVGLLIDAALPEHTAGLVIDGRQQMHGPRMPPERAAQRLAVNAHRGQIVVGQFKAERLANPAAQDGFENLRIELHQQIAEAVQFGRPPRVPHPMPDVNRQIVKPLGDRRIAAIATQHSTCDGRQHGGQRMASSLTPTWVRDLRQARQQVHPAGG